MELLDLLVLVAVGLELLVVVEDVVVRTPEVLLVQLVVLQASLVQMIGLVRCVPTLTGLRGTSVTYATPTSLGTMKVA